MSVSVSIRPDHGRMDIAAGFRDAASRTGSKRGSLEIGRKDKQSSQ